MTITAKVIADSISPKGIRLTSLQLRYPRFIHAEFMTHRKFSRNASSSRAVPVERLIEDVLADPAKPIHWGLNKRGMQADQEIPDRLRRDAVVVWEQALNSAVAHARRMNALNVHKQIVNRILEPFSHINVVCTATDWANWFALRDHEDAQPEIAELARQIRVAIDGSEPRELVPGRWHLPYLEADELEAMDWPYDAYDHAPLIMARMISAARCARVSYKTHDGSRPSHDADLALYDRLVTSELVHASPLEHQATPDDFGPSKAIGRRRNEWRNPHLHGNFRGWIQHRKLVPNEAAHG